MTYFTTGLGLLYFFVLSTVCMLLIVNLKLKNMLYCFGTKLKPFIAKWEKHGKLYEVALNFKRPSDMVKFNPGFSQIVSNIFLSKNK